MPFILQAYECNNESKVSGIMDQRGEVSWVLSHSKSCVFTGIRYKLLLVDDNCPIFSGTTVASRDERTVMPDLILTGIDVHDFLDSCDNILCNVIHVE